MTNNRCFERLAAAAVILLATALPGAADGVSQFEQKIRPQLPPNFLTYAKAKALGDNGFVLEDVVVTADGIGGAKAGPVAIKRVTVDHFDFAGLDKGVPLFLKIRVEGITVASKPVAGVDLNELAGVDRVVADFGLDYRVDPDRKTLTLDKLELDVGSLARFELSLVLDGVSPDLAGKPDAAMNGATLRSATLIFEDRSLLSKVPAGCRQVARYRCRRDNEASDDDPRWNARRPERGDARGIRCAWLLSRRLQASERTAKDHRQPT